MLFKIKKEYEKRMKNLENIWVETRVRNYVSYKNPSA